MHMRKPGAGKRKRQARRRKCRRCPSKETSLQGCKDHTHISCWDLPLSRSVNGGLALPGALVGGEIDAVAEAALKGDGEVQAEELPP